jgi:hypothetical protein
MTSTSRDSNSPSFEAAILDFPLPVWLYSIPTILTEMLNFANVGLAVEIMFLSYTQTEI